MKKTALLLLFIQTYLYAQIFTEKNLDKDKLPEQFHEVNAAFSENIQNDSVDFYPLNDGDLWEYIVNNDDTLLGERMTYYSFIKEVIKDTLMENGKTYAQLKFCSCANSSNKPVEYFYHRKDSTGNVYEYVDNQEYLLFDFTKTVNETYPSRYENHQWKIAKKYTVTGFGTSNLNAVDFQLIDKSNIARQYATVIENFGLIFFSGTIGGYTNLPSWTFYGAIINGSDYGELIGKGQQTDWNEYYPLHVGDIWKYDGFVGPIDEKRRLEIIGDTIMPNMEKFYIKEFTRLYANKITSGIASIEIIDSTGKVYHWINNTPELNFKFLTCIGDTFSDNDNFSWLLSEKGKLIDGEYALDFMVIPDLINYHLIYEKGIGLVKRTDEQAGKDLIGAVIDGKMIGSDTTAITSVEKINNLPSDFILKQNYPNPFNPSTTIEFSIPFSGNVVLEIYDLLGQKVITLIDEYLAYGNYKAVWNGVSGNSRTLSSGVYVYRLSLDNNFLNVKKMTLIK